MKRILKKIGGIAGLVAMAGIVIAALQLWQSLVDSRDQSHVLATMLASQEHANATTVFILEQQFKIQSDIGTLEAGDVKGNPTVIAKQIQDLEETAIALKSTKSAVESTSTARAMIQLPYGETTIFDGFSHYGTSGFNFSLNKLVGWDSNSADILVSKDNINPQVSFFIPYDAPPYNNPTLDKNARSGIITVSQLQLSTVFECPESGYKYHWVKATENAIYCLRTRDGSHYAIIQVTSLSKYGVSINWIYQPDGSRSFQ